MKNLPITFNTHLDRLKTVVSATIASILPRSNYFTRSLILLLMAFIPFGGSAQSNFENILGKWMSNENNLIVEVYKTGKEFKGKIVWFSDNDDKSQPMLVRLDTKNPESHLRNRKILGLEVMKGLYFNEKLHEWQNGHIYDATRGKNWNAKAWISKEGILNVRGFWHVEWLGENLSFRRL